MFSYKKFLNFLNENIIKIIFRKKDSLKQEHDRKREEHKKQLKETENGKKDYNEHDNDWIY